LFLLSSAAEPEAVVAEAIEEGRQRTRRGFGDASEAAEFVAMLEKFERGEISADEYRGYRLTRGIYGQRQDEVHMVRVKIPQGVLSGLQLRVLADCADRYSRGFGHVTTRQNLQFHFVKPRDVAPFMEAVARSGLTTREACSHTVRNIAACASAGVCDGAPFDVTPYAEAMTRHFLRHALGSGLPRKFKISASGCEDDCGQGAINDIGILARVRDGQRGFRVTAGGGTSTLPRSGAVLHEFLPADEVLEACEAILRVFNAEGERKNLKKARMKWAIERLGFPRFRALYEEQRAAIAAEGGRPYTPGPEEEPPPRRASDPVPLRLVPREGYAAFQQSNVRSQRQKGFSTVEVRLKLGDVSSAKLRGLADLIERLGDGSLRTTNAQNLLLRWVRDEDLARVHQELSRLGIADAHAASLSDVVSCPGAETCRIAVTASRGIAQVLDEHLRAGDGTRAKGADGDIRISGCPNGCGQHHIAAIGLQGGVRRLGDKLVPQYHLAIGGGVDGTGAKFGRLVGKVPARRVAQAVDRLVAHFEANRSPGETQRAFFQRLSLKDAQKLIADLTEIDLASAKPEDFVDLGSEAAFKVVEMDGECAQ
jgi:sulfite reductase (NADPH) hemoprotein beta-component